MLILLVSFVLRIISITEQVVDLSSLLPVDEVSSLLQTDFSIKSSRKVGFSADSQLNLCNFLVMFDTEHGHKIKLRLLNADEMAVLGELKC